MAKDQAMVSVWGYQAFLVEVLEGVELYLQFVTKFGEILTFSDSSPGTK